MHPKNDRTRPVRALGVAVLVLATIAGSLHYRESPIRFAKDIARHAALRLAGVLYAADAEIARERSAKVRVGIPPERPPAVESWEHAAFAAPALSVAGGSAFGRAATLPSFVWEDPDAPPLARFREECGLLDVVAGAAGEYEAQLALGGWVAARIRKPPRPRTAADPPLLGPLDVLRLAEEGKELCCDAVNTLTIHAATALGWPARRVLVARDGARCDRAVAELWSNEFRKWFLLDTAYNQVFELDGCPLSAFELCRDGADLPRSGRLRVRAVGPAPGGGHPAAGAPSFSYIHLDPFAYVHVDLRNDWLTRPLRRGSPAGGEHNTLWTARAGRPSVLTCGRREDRRSAFDWPVNVVEIRAMSASELPNGAVEVEVGLSAYSPYFEAFALSLDDGPWWDLEEPSALLTLAPGFHRISARVLTRGGPGPAYEAHLSVRPGTAVAVGRSLPRT